MDIFLEHKPVIVRFKRAAVKKVLEVSSLVLEIHGMEDRLMAILFIYCIFSKIYIFHSVQSLSQSVSSCQAHKASEGEVKAANLAIIGQLKQFSVDCHGAVRADPKKKLLTQDLRCEEEVRAKLTVDRLLQEKVEAAMLQARSGQVKSCIIGWNSFLKQLAVVGQ